MNTLIPFRPFCRDRALRVYDQGVLPHWRQDGCAYFVTFRLADSLPKTVQYEMAENRRRWLKKKGIDIPDGDWRETLARVPELLRSEYLRLVSKQREDSLDRGFGSCLLRFTRFRYIVREALIHFHGNRVLTGDLVIMPNHVHVILTPIGGFELESILHSVKSFTANEINRERKCPGAIWQKESYDHIVRDSRQLIRFQKYIRRNPSKAGLPESSYSLRNARYDIY